MRSLVKCMLLSQLLIVVGKSSRALLCLPCDESKCEEPERCPGALLLEVCGCCSACAKQRNENCGGAYGQRGTCDRGLRCVIRPTPNGGSITPHVVGVCEDENWVDDPPLDSGPCDGNLVSGCNIMKGECECGQLWTCVNPFQFPSPEACQSALRRTKATTVVDCSAVECSPVHQVLCPSDSYETQVGLTADGCCLLQTRCQCLPGPCDPPPCPTGSSPRVISPSLGTPGRCCGSFECVIEAKPSCVLDGVERGDGEVIRVDACRFCRCQDGVPVCFLARCGTPPCEHHYIPKGECCPVCEDPSYPAAESAGCYVNGRKRAHRERWREDDCVFCTCAGGETHCATAVCGRGCVTMATAPGECCPVCQESTDTSMAPSACGALNCRMTEQDCDFGFEKDQRGCDTCRCRTGEEVCRGLMAGCTLDCPSGFLTDDRGCTVCRCRLQLEKCRSVACSEDCALGFTKNKHGCDACQCKKCPELSCDMACPIGFQQDDSGCFVCRCRDPPVPSIMPMAAGAEPCLSVDGRWHGDGESWQDGCRDCYCRNSREMCAAIYCRVPVCAYPSARPGQCCPACPDDDVSHPPEPAEPVACLDSGDGHFAEGEAWRVDPCTRCVCAGGQVLCETEGCPPAPCQNPIRAQDTCCPRCQGEASAPPSPGNRRTSGHCTDQEGRAFLAGQSWRPDACTSCVCSDGSAACFSESCPQVGCARPVLLKGHCCPSCLEDAAPRAECLFNGKLYADEERWDLDGCTHCYCLQGQTLCSTVSCPALPCHQPISIKGSCCPICSELSLPVVKTDPRESSQMHQPSWSLGNQNNIMPQLSGKFGSLQHVRRPQPAASDGSPFHSVAWAAVPVLVILASITAILFISQNRKWILPPSCYSAEKYACPSGQRACADCHRSGRAGSGGTQHVLWVKEPDARHSGYCSAHHPNSLQADSFYQTV